VLRYQIQKENDPIHKKLLQANELSILEEAYEESGQSNVAAGALAAARERMGDTDSAIEVLSVGLDKNPADNRLRDLWIRYEIDKNNPEKALEIAIDGARIDPTSWRMQRHIARLKRSLDDDMEAVKGHYEAAVRHNKGDTDLLVEFGAYLFMNRNYADAERIFKEACECAPNSQERRKIRARWKNSDGQRILFSGKVKSVRGTVAYATAIPEGFDAFFWKTSPELAKLREGDPIDFAVGFNADGAFAHVHMS
jgi:tetratricopeptide (TPR) repeat protein